MWGCYIGVSVRDDACVLAGKQAALAWLQWLLSPCCSTILACLVLSDAHKREWGRYT